MEIGPMIPPHLRNNRDSSDSDQSDHETTFGPALPKHLLENREKNLEKDSEEYYDKKSQNISLEETVSVGPRLPSHLQKRLCSDKKGENGSDHEDSEEDDCYGPALPPGYNTNRKEEKHATQYADESSDEGEVIGPMPHSAPGEDEYLERAKWDIEARARVTKEKMTGKKDEKLQRETWMTELPPELGKNFGLGARKFRARAVELGDQSVWTDTPADKAKKVLEGGVKKKVEETELQKTSWEADRDASMEKIVERHNKRHRGESLMDMHKKKLKKKKEEEACKPKERRPFDREQDLVLHRVSDKEKKSFIKKSQELGSRFQSARQGSAYL